MPTKSNYRTAHIMDSFRKTKPLVTALGEPDCTYLTLEPLPLKKGATLNTLSLKLHSSNGNMDSEPELIRLDIAWTNCQYINSGANSFHWQHRPANRKTQMTFQGTGSVDIPGPPGIDALSPPRG
ncbi:hypothetical protein Nepgr_028883 [Nepenthes gracilis]|uniref:Uncharacterized protein n=1 Tax=Nepenthes gracilis TaxID=150966 RepID=A0AAD3TCI8_NEPGR|nr:hypothetical protein Nepgr_028883 [Nepenthes gracilis]